jgi:acyl-CoA thioesterase FadM
MVSRWPVVLSVPVDASDREADGVLTKATVERVFAQARRAYFERCKTVNASTVEVRATSIRQGEAAAGDDVTVSVSVTEVFPDRFTMTARIRPVDGDGIAATAWCALSPAGGVPTAMRDEFIALAHAAARTH